MVRKWASRLVTLFLLLLVGFVGYCQVSMVVTMNKNYGVPSVFGYSFLYVATDSMDGDLPDSLPIGTGIVIQDVDPHSIAPGDVITFYYPAIGAPDTHRVHEIAEDGEGHLTFYTRGDNLNAQLSNGQWDENYREVVPAPTSPPKCQASTTTPGGFSPCSSSCPSPSAPPSPSPRR